MKGKKKPATIKIDFKKVFKKPSFSKFSPNAIAPFSFLVIAIVIMVFISMLAGNSDANIGKGLASVAVCGLGAFSMYVSDGETGIGWAIFGLILIW